MNSPFEVLMLVCFGTAWPFSIYRSLKTNCVKGKSPVFLVIVFAGYVAGIVHKIIYNYDLVIFFYILNAIMVAIDTGLYFEIQSRS